MMKKIIYKTPHGYYEGGGVFERYSPAVTISSWEYNNFVIEYEENEIENE